jgi:hypothetical protein
MTRGARIRTDRRAISHRSREAVSDQPSMIFMRSTGPPAGQIPRSAGRLREIEALLHPAARGEDGGMGAEVVDSPQGRAETTTNNADFKLHRGVSPH